ncbi:hypothetical protein NDU88_008195 [Pleurodeles waltl]|uniref:Uncharacterized protein n=1 Tax=Pleurodeles waltl TaxID=8319 RepID=A0AAV7NVH8_PLEWA|nr:hypothetical protein NDU88_008195 [Pleurodeles waltl]
MVAIAAWRRLVVAVVAVNEEETPRSTKKHRSIAEVEGKASTQVHDLGSDSSGIEVNVEAVIQVMRRHQK